VLGSWEAWHGFLAEGARTSTSSSSSIGLLEEGDELKGALFERAMCNVAGSDGGKVETEIEGSFGKRLDGERNLDLSNGSVVEDFFSGVGIGDGAEIEGFVVLS
jgi:hypothetical protein